MKTESKPSEVFPQRLRAAREMRRWSQNELGQRSGLPPSSVAHFEAGSRKPSFDSLHRVAAALEVTTDYLLGRTDDPSLANDGDPLFRDVGRLTGDDRELARQFLEMLSQRNQSQNEDNEK